MDREQARKLLGGYATGNLTEAERKALFEASLEDDALFAELMAEQELREIVALPGARERLLRAVGPAPAQAARWPWWRARWAWGLAGVAGVVAASFLIWKGSRSGREPVLISQSEFAAPAGGDRRGPERPLAQQESPAAAEQPPAATRSGLPRSAEPMRGRVPPAEAAQSRAKPETAAATGSAGASGPGGVVGGVFGGRTPAPPPVKSPAPAPVRELASVEERRAEQRRDTAPREPVAMSAVAPPGEAAPAAVEQPRTLADARKANEVRKSTPAAAPPSAVSQTTSALNLPAREAAPAPLRFSFRISGASAAGQFVPGATLRLEVDRSGGPHFVVARRNAAGGWSVLSASREGWLIPTEAATRSVELLLVLSRTPVAELNRIAANSSVAVQGEWRVVEDPAGSVDQLAVIVTLRASGN
jgi:hypothetical protein